MTPTAPASSSTVVGIGECRAINSPGGKLITYALGSCIAVVAWDPLTKTGGLLHLMLPDSALDSVRGKNNPALFADTGIPHLIECCMKLGASRSRLVLRAAGGAKVLEQNGMFDIGNRNHISMRKALWKAGLFLQGEDTGGTLARTVSLELNEGLMMIREGGAPWRELPARRKATAAAAEVAGR